MVLRDATCQGNMIVGFFEQKLGALGETVDETIERTSLHAKELCDKEGITEKVIDWREQAVEAVGRWRQFVLRHWAALDDAQKKRCVLMAWAVCLVLLALVMVIRLRPKPITLDTQSQELVRSLQRQHAPGMQHFSANSTGASHTMP